MTFRSGRKIHPEIEAYLGKLRLARFVLVVSLVAAPAAVILLWTLGNMPKDLLGPIRLAVCVIALMAYLVMGRIVDKARASAESAARVLAMVEPRPMTMEIVGMTGLGALQVRLRPLDEASQTLLPVLATVRATKNKQRLSKGPLEVQVHFQPLSVDRSVVIEGQEAVFWGRWSERESRPEKSSDHRTGVEPPAEKVAGTAFKSSFPRWLKLIGSLMIILLIATGILFAVVSSGAIRAGQRELALARASLNWQRAPGKIVAARLQRKTIHKSRGSSVIYEPAIVFQYEWHGRLRRGTLIHFGLQPSNRKSVAQRWLKKYPVDRRVMPAVAPGPSPVAVLEPGHMDDCESIIARRKRQLMVMMITILSVLVLTIFLLRFLLRRGNSLLIAVNRSGTGRR